MNYWVYLSGLLCCAASFGYVDTAESQQEQAETRYWAGIITVRTVASGDTVYLVPESEKSDAGGAVRYRTQEQMPLTIRRVMEDSPASAAGLMPGDILLEYSGQPLSVHADLVAAIQANAGGAAIIRLSRGGEVRELELRAIPRPADYAERVLSDRAAEQAEMGALSAKSGAGVVVLPNNLADLLALAAKGAETNDSEVGRPEMAAGGQAEALESQSAGNRQDEGDLSEAAGAVNFDRSTRLLMDKLDEFSREWSDLLERQRQTLRQWSGQF